MEIAPFKLERFFSPYEFSIDHVLCASDCETMTVGQLLELDDRGTRDLLSLSLSYSPMEGLTSLRAAIADLYENCEGEDVIVVTGGGCAIELGYYATLQPDDRVIVMTPCYESAFEWASFLRCQVIAWPLRETDQGWQMDLDELRTLMTTHRPKLLSFNLPHNPTGYLPTSNLFGELLQLADQFDVRVFSDEIFRFTEHDPTRCLPSAVDLHPKAISLGAMSKSFGMPGLRIGWLVTRDVGLRQQIVRFLDYTSKDSSAVSQLLAEIAIQHRSSIVTRNMKLAIDNLDLLDRLMRENSDQIAWHRPAAGVIAFPRFVDGRDTNPLFRQLVDQGVLLAPGHLFSAPASHFRIGFSRRDFATALPIFQQTAGLRPARPVDSQPH